MKMMLVLSHGQNFVERGFSINKDILRFNMLERTLVVAFSSKWILKVLKSMFFIPLEVVRIAKGEEEAI